MIEVYVGICSCMIGVDRSLEIVYAGIDHHKALEAVRNHKFECDLFQSGWIETWVDGEIVGRSDIIR